MFEFFKESREELRKVTWPDREEVLNSTIIILVAVVFVSIALFIMDAIFEGMFDMFINLFT